MNRLYRYIIAAVAAMFLCGAAADAAGIHGAEKATNGTSGNTDSLNTIAVRKANASEGKMLTMEETILSRELAPESISLYWSESGKSLRSVANDSLYSINPVDGTRKAIGPAPENGPEAVRSALGHYAFVRDNGLYISDKDGRTTTVAEPEFPGIVYGQVVSRNEFNISGGLFWSPDGRKLAFYRKDESQVGQFPLLDISTRTGTLKELRYPMAGMPSEKISLGVFDVETMSLIYLQTACFDDEQYLTNVTWSPDSRHIFIQVLARSQKEMQLNMFDASTGENLRTILTESNDKYVEPLDPLYFIKGSNERFIYRTNNRDGYRNLYLCDIKGNIERLTAVDADVEYIANDGKYVYYTSAEVSPVENHLFRISLRTMKPVQLTKEPGWHTVSMNRECTMYIDRYSSLTVPGVTAIHTASGKRLCNILTSTDPTEGYAYTEISLGTVKSADGKYDNYYRLIKPKDFDPSKKYPVILYVYGGPHSQMVRDTWLAELRRWEMYMAQRGYLVYIQDNRGTLNRGREFEQAIHGQCGQAEMADQMEGVKMLMDLPYVDKERIGVHGWSYGGFMTISLITNYPDIFKVAVAGGPVIDWKWYEVMYGERYMDHPDRNAAGYEKVSLINRAKDLKGKLLICQGAVDPVVVWQHSLSFVQECIDNNVQVDYFPYPKAEHNMFGRERVHLMDKVTMYFEDYL